MIRLKGVHIAKVDEVCTAAESTVMHHKGGTISDRLVMDAHAPIGHVWHSRPHPAEYCISIAILIRPIRHERAKSAARSSPAQLLQCHAGMPYLRHVADLAVSELHDVDVVRSRLFAGRLTRAAGTGMSTRKDSIGSDVVSFGIGGE